MRKKILVVDDIEINRLLLNNLFYEQFDVLEAENGEQALALIDEHLSEICIVLLDLIMPVMDGFEVLRRMNKDKTIQSVPVILITGDNDTSNALLGYGLGVSDLIHKPFDSEIVVRRVNNVIDLYAYKNFLEQKLQEQRLKLEKQAEKIKRSNLFLIDALSTTVEFRNFESGEHVKRMRTFTKMLMHAVKDEYNLTDEQVDSISTAAALHDIGKIAIPDAVLLKPGRLTPEEFEIMKTHTVRGCEIIESLHDFEDTEYYRYGYDICRSHHERWDGRGYPDKLKGDEIPVWAQAASIADVYDALTNNRVYKPAYSHDEAAAMILRGECGTFNPKFLKLFEDLQEQFRAQTQQNKI